MMSRRFTPPSSVLDVVSLHTDQPFTKFDLAQSIRRNRETLRTATQPESVALIGLLRGRDSLSVHENTNSLEVHAPFDVADAFNAANNSMSIRRCECGEPMLYGNKHINCPLNRRDV